eukprot:gene30172-biopygen28880
MFHSATSFNQRLDTWDVGHVTCMLGVFCRATAFNQPLGAWDVGHVTNTSVMFQGGLGRSLVTCE